MRQNSKATLKCDKKDLGSWLCIPAKQAANWFRKIFQSHDEKKEVQKKTVTMSCQRSQQGLVDYRHLYLLAHITAQLSIGWVVLVNFEFVAITVVIRT